MQVMSIELREVQFFPAPELPCIGAYSEKLDSKSRVL